MATSLLGGRDQLARLRQPVACAVRMMHAAHVDEPGEVRLIGRRCAWMSGLLHLALGAAIAVAISASVIIAVHARDGEAQVLASVGVTLAAPGLGALTVVFIDIGWRQLRPRRGVVELLDDRIVVHDRWLLRRPVEIYRSEIREIRRLPRLRYWQYTAFAGQAGRELGESAALLDLGGIPNTVLALHTPRRFREAIWTLPTKTPIQRLSRGTATSGLMLRLADPDTAVERLTSWMSTARSRRAPTRDTASGCASTIALTVLIVAGITGFVMFNVALYLGATR